jgi:hypothetical protein
MAATQATLVSPTERMYAGIVGDLFQRFKEMWDKPPPSAERLLRWTECAGRDPEWVRVNAAGLRRWAKSGLPIRQDEFDTWKFSIQREMTRPSQPGEPLSDWYDRLRRLHGFEFPTYKDEPFWRWRFEAVSEFIHEGRGGMCFGLSGAGKTAAVTLGCEALAFLKDEQIAYGNRSTLAQMAGKKIGKGGRPDSPPDPDNDHLGMWYSRDVRFISNYSVYDDPKTGYKSPLVPRWNRQSKLSGLFLETAKCIREGYFFGWPIDEAGFVADKFTQGSERVKSIIGTTRIVRGFNGFIWWITQYGPDDFPKELVKSAETKWFMAEPRHGKAQGKATITVPGSPLHERIVTDIPLPVSGFDTTDKPVLEPDVSVSRLLQSIAEERQALEAEQGTWGREEKANSLVHAVQKQLHDRDGPM